MLQKKELEKVAVLKSAKTTSMNDAPLIDLCKQAAKFSHKGKYIEAGNAYGVLATLIKDDLNFPLRAAHAYQKASEDEDAARWFIRSAERYAKQNYPTQAVATLRLYHSLKPDEHLWPKRIYKLCRNHGEADDIVPFLSTKDQAGRKLHGNDLFAIFDDDTFDVLLDRMKYRSLADQEPLAHMGDRAESLFFVTHGSLECYLTLNGQRTYLGVIEAGSICGEVAYFTGGRHTSELLAKGATNLLELPYTLIDSLKQDSESLSDHLEALYKSNMLVKQLALASIFQGIDVDTRREIAEHMTLLEVPAGQVLFQEGERSSDVYIVRRGKLAVNISVDSTECLVKILETGCVFGEMAILTGNKRTATVQSTSDCSLMRLNASDYLNIYQKNSQLKAVLEQRKSKQMAETHHVIQQLNEVEGDDACTLLLKDIWRTN